MSTSGVIALIGVSLALAASIILLVVQYGKRKTSESQLRRLSRHLISVQEEERKQIARELHDNLGQRIALARINFEMALQDDVKLSDGKTQARFESILTELEELGDDTQHLSHTLLSSKLQYMGLTAGLKELCRQVEPPPAIDLEADDFARAVPKEIELCIYRVAQEALHNIAKHSGADRVVFRLIAGGTVLRLEISDNGKGFDPREPSQELALGAMRERLSIVSGDLQITSRPGQGTVLSVRVPYAEATNHESLKS